MSKTEVIKNRLTVSFHCKGQISKFFVKNKFIAEYDTSVEKVPEAIMIIPFLATVSPIAWANQAKLVVETVDATFLSSLNIVRKTLQKLYPKMKFAESIQAKNIVSPSINARTRRMLLFTGGIDSLTTHIRHEYENLILVSVQESDFATNTVEQTKDIAGFNVSMHISPQYLEEFSTITESENRIIKSNWIFLLDDFWLKVYQTELSGENWYRRVMHGLAFSGLCAPLAYLEKVDKLYIASSFTADAQFPWGSHPDIDNSIKWAGTRVEHDGYELSRQEKMFLIANYIKDKAGIQICSCTGEDINVGSRKNCSLCEKCGRTILGLELAGVDPNKHGFSVDARTFSYIKKKIEGRDWHFRDDEIFMWKDLQKHTNNVKDLPHREAMVLIDWLRRIDIESFRVKYDRSRREDSFLRILPYPIFKLVEKLYIKYYMKFCRKYHKR